MAEDELPTLGRKVAEWLGFQLPGIPLPQTLKNLDKAFGTLVTALGENFETRIKASTGKAEVKGKIEVEKLHRNQEEERKHENRIDTMRVAVEDMTSKPPIEDATAEIDDDWLNLFVRLAEDKSSEELKTLYGKILSGEIRKPGSFSLRTIQFISTLSKKEAGQVSQFLSYAIARELVPLLPEGKPGPDIATRIRMEEFGLASHPSQIGGLAWKVGVRPNSNFLMEASRLSLIVQNSTPHEVTFTIPCQMLSTAAKELILIANPPPTDLEYLKEVAQVIFESIRETRANELLAGQVRVVVGMLLPVGEGQQILEAYVAKMPGQS